MGTKKEDTATIDAKKECFIISPIGQAETEINKKANGLYNAVIKPVLNDLDYTCVRADEIDSSGSINNQIINKIIEAELVIVNLSGLNPNVMYELALRHAIGKPVIMLKEGSFNDMPFDIIDQRTILYSDDLNSVVFTQEELRKKIKGIKDNSEIDNPFLTAQRLKRAISEVDSNNNSTDIVMSEVLKELRSIRTISVYEKNSYNEKRNYNDKFYVDSLVMDSNKIIHELLSDSTKLLLDFNANYIDNSEKIKYINYVQSINSNLQRLNSKWSSYPKG